jgi:hypothetical protein
MKPDYRRWGSGNNPPCRENEIIDVMRRGGDEVLGVRAGQVIWWHLGSPHQPENMHSCDDAYNDVIAWRPAVKPNDIKGFPS